MPQRRADDEHGEEVGGCLDQPRDRRLDGVEHGILHHEVVDRVAGQAQLGEDARRRRRPRRTSRADGEHRLGVGGRVGDRDRDRARGDAREAVPVGALEREGCAHGPSLAGRGEGVSDAAAMVVWEGEACAT